MIDERNHRNAGERCDHPPGGRPENQNVSAELVPDVEQDAGLDTAAKGHEQGSERHGKAGENDQLECDQPLLHQSPSFGKFVTAAEAFHPGDHYARSGPEGKQ